MTKKQFIEKLETELNRNNVADSADIIEEYNEHFTFKLADGYSEEEISAKLGDPKEIAAQYEPSAESGKRGKKIMTLIGLYTADFLFGIFYILLIAWEIVMGALSISFAATAVCLFSNIRQSFFTLVPKMPYQSAFIFGLSFIFLTLITAIGTVYFFLFIRQLMRSFKRFHKNTVAYASNRATLPTISIYPQFSKKANRNLRTLFLIAVMDFAACFIIAFVVSVISSGSFQFWHIWKWFI